MTQRTLIAGPNPNVIIKAGNNLTIKGQENDFITAESEGGWGMQIEKRAESEVGRAKAVVGERVLFDIRLKMRGAGTDNEVIEIKIGGSAEIYVPVGSNLKVYAGHDIHVEGIKGQVDAYSGHNLLLTDVYCVGNASAGKKMDLDCQTMAGTRTEFKSGGDLRFYIRDLNSAHIQVKDIGGYWQAQINGGEKSIYLKSGGDVTLVTDQKVEALPPNYLLGKIEKPT